MSMPTYNIECDSCDYSASNTMIWGSFDYEMEKRRMSVNRTIGWCNACNGFQPIECFDIDSDDEKSVWNDFDDFQKEVLPSFWRYFLARINGHYGINKLYSETIRQRMEELILAARRKGDERCLTCGSQDHKPFNVAVNLKYEAAYYGVQPTGFIHPGCGGQIQLKGSRMRFNIVFDTVKVYSPEGRFLREEPVAERR